MGRAADKIHQPAFRPDRLAARIHIVQQSVRVYMDGMRIAAGPDDRRDIGQDFLQPNAHKIHPVQPLGVATETALRTISGKDNLVERVQLAEGEPVKGGYIAGIPLFQKFTEPF